jgi:Mn2+/Fe2+ NRAMP family transporter
VLIVNQEMVARLGAVTGVGHARLIFARFGKLWGAFSVGDLLVLNFLTIVTEFIGVSLAMRHFGVSQYVSVPAMAVVLLVVVATGSFRRWERCMYVSVAVSLLMIPLAMLSHPRAGVIIHDTLVPGVQGGLNSTVLLLVIATAPPWRRGSCSSSSPTSSTSGSRHAGSTTSGRTRSSGRSWSSRGPPP